MPIPKTLPQEAPTKRLGINRPLDTMSPYVQLARQKYRTANMARLIQVYDTRNREIENSGMHQMLYFTNKPPHMSGHEIDS